MADARFGLLLVPKDEESIQTHIRLDSGRLSLERLMRSGLENASSCGDCIRCRFSTFTTRKFLNRHSIPKKMVEIGNLRTAGVIGAILVTLATAGVTFGPLSNTLNVPNTGVLTTTNIGVYTTQQCTTNLTSLSWGSVRAGSSYTRTAYIRNNGNSDLTLSMTTTNWNPSALSSVLQVTWNYGGGRLTPGQVLAVTWTLSIPSGVSGYTSFGFDLSITGTEV